MRVQTQLRAGMYASITLAGGMGSGPAVQQPMSPQPEPYNTTSASTLSQPTPTTSSRQ